MAKTFFSGVITMTLRHEWHFRKVLTPSSVFCSPTKSAFLWSHLVIRLGSGR